MIATYKKTCLILVISSLIIDGCIPYLLLTNINSFQGTSILRTQSLTGLGEVESLDLTVICDNYPNGDLIDEWGVSILIETKDTTVLLDTGQSYSGLRHNSLALNKDLSNVDFVVISHEHWDHVGGLSYIEEINPGVTVYLPDHIDSNTFNTINQSNLNAVKIADTTIIQPGIAIIGEMYGPPYEQALAINVKDVGLVGIMGCSHPGVDNLIEKAVDDLGVIAYMVIGGFHMVSGNEQAIQNTIDGLLELGVKKIYPIHCSGDLFRQYMSEHYSLEYGQGNVGFQIIINAFTINWWIYSIVIPVSIVSLSVVLIWFFRKKTKART